MDEMRDELDMIIDQFKVLTRNGLKVDEAIASLEQWKEEFLA